MAAAGDQAEQCLGMALHDFQGLAAVRMMHHVLAWGFILFIVVHIYMAFWYDAVLKEGTLSSMVTGNIFQKGEHRFEG